MCIGDPSGDWRHCGCCRLFMMAGICSMRRRRDARCGTWIRYAFRSGRNGRWRGAGATVPHAGHRARGRWTCTYEARLAAVRAPILWVLSLLHFFIVAPTLVFLGIFLDPRKTRLSAARIVPPHRVFIPGHGWRCNARQASMLSAPVFFMVNHVNIFDPFFCMPRFRSLRVAGKLESHFRIPAYGWLMKRFGNVAGTGCAASLGFETHVAAYTGRH